MGVEISSRRKNAKFPGAHGIGAAISGPRIAGKTFYGHEDFSEFWFCPDPPTLAFLKKSKGNPEKSKDFSLCGTLKILGEERKNVPKKARKIRKLNKKTRRSEKTRIGGSGNCRQNIFRTRVFF